MQKARARLTLGQEITRLQRIFAEAGVEAPRRKAQLLIAEVCGLAYEKLLTQDDRPLPPASLSKLDDMKNRLLGGEPLSRVLGHREFWGQRFFLNEATLDPRPDSERLIEVVLALYPDEPPATILDLGTGSGCLLITLLRAFPKARGLGTDISFRALEAARRNSKRLLPPDRVHFSTSDWFSALQGRWDLIVANPPYVAEHWRGKLGSEVEKHDPEKALFAGEDGCKAYRTIAEKASSHLCDQGHLVLEIGYDQREAVTAIFAATPLTYLGCYQDLAGKDRVLCFQKREKGGAA